MKREIEKIAKKVLFLDTLETRKLGELDFHEHSVWCIKEALEQAFRAGQADIIKKVQRQLPPYSPVMDIINKAKNIINE